jgi:hypothetical protein
MSFSGRSEPFAHETRKSARNDPRTSIVLNGTAYRVILHAEERLWKSASTSGTRRSCTRRPATW